MTHSDHGGDETDSVTLSVNLSYCSWFEVAVLVVGIFGFAIAMWNHQLLAGITAFSVAVLVGYAPVDVGEGNRDA